MPRPVNIAHRGASAVAPENTLAAFRWAARLGAEAIETDVRISRDGQFVLFHDRLLRRTTSARGTLAAQSLARLRELDAGSWFAPRYAGQRIPLLREALAFAQRHRLGLFLELKPRLSKALLRQFLRELQEVPLAQVTVLGFRRSTLQGLRALAPALRTGLLVRRRARAVHKALTVGAQLLAVHRTAYSRRLLEQAHRAGLGVVVWTVNDPRTMHELAASGVDGIMTDYPDRLAAVLGRCPDVPLRL